MTGFGRCLVESEGIIQQWEIKSVNGRYLDLKWRLPPGIRFLEPSLEKVVRGRAARGHVEISLHLQFGRENAPQPVFDVAAAEGMIRSLSAFASARNAVFEPDYSRFLAVPTLWSEPCLEQAEELGSQLEDGLAIALDDWNESRLAEGAALGRDLQARVQHMEEWAEALEERAPEIREERIAQLRQRVSEALSGLGQTADEGRLLQECVLLADKLDVSEEITRLFAHLERLRQLLHQGADAGRRLDFTLQECFREISTCGTKLADPGLSHLIGDFKNELEKCREQVQNLE